MIHINFTAPVHALQVVLTCTDRGWNYAVLHDGQPLHTGEPGNPADLSSVEDAMSLALQALRDHWTVKS